MRGVFWFLGLAAVAVALALLVGNNEAMVTLFWHPYRVDISFNLLLFALLLLFVLLHLALRGIAALRALPGQARRWRRLQLEGAIVEGVLEAMANQLAGRFVRAQSAARHAIGQLRALPADASLPQRDRVHVLAHLLAAESAQALGARDERNAALAAALDPVQARGASEAREGALLRAVRWALDDRDAASAERWLAQLPQGAARRIQAQRLRLRLAQLQGDATEALEIARVLAKHRAFSAEAAHSITRSLILDAVRDTHEPSQLERLWQSLDESEQAMPAVMLAVLARRETLLALEAAGPVPGADSPAGLGGDDAPADDAQDDVVNGQALDLAGADDALGREVVQGLWRLLPRLSLAERAEAALRLEPLLPRLGSDWLAAVEAAQRAAPADVALQYLAGQAFRRQGLWGKAAQMLGQAGPRLPDGELRRRCWRALALLAEERGDLAAAQAAWKRAAA